MNQTTDDGQRLCGPADRLHLEFPAGSDAWPSLLSPRLPCPVRPRLFLWEIYSPEYGFRMPWLQVRAGTGASHPSGAADPMRPTARSGPDHHVVLDRLVLLLMLAIVAAILTAAMITAVTPSGNSGARCCLLQRSRPCSAAASVSVQQLRAGEVERGSGHQSRLRAPAPLVISVRQTCCSISPPRPGTISYIGGAVLSFFLHGSLRSRRLRCRGIVAGLRDQIRRSLVARARRTGEPRGFP